MNWIVCQIGAREHYAIPRALYSDGNLDELITDFWATPGRMLSRIPAARRLRDRYHPDLEQANVHAPHGPMLGHELFSRVLRRRGWPDMMARNAVFQEAAVSHLAGRPSSGDSSRTLFSYSYAARHLFRLARSRGWRTVLGQIDPGPEEERIVAEEHARYPGLSSTWKPAPPQYWDDWREELDLADVVLVNSAWSRHCLVKSGVAAEKIKIVPLVYDGAGPTQNLRIQEGGSKTFPLQVLFLGQINLRKGVGRLLDAMRLLKDHPIELTLAGPTELDPSAWADLPSVTWVGPVPRSAVGGYYHGADVFILPTLSDGYALTQLEALAHGLPVIASKNCGEAVDAGKNGVLLDQTEPAAIAEALLAFLDSSVRLSAEGTDTFTSADLADSLRSI